MRAREWRPTDQTSQAVLDLAAGRPFDLETTDHLPTLLSRHGLFGLAALSASPIMTQVSVPAFARLRARQAVMVRHLRRLLDEFAAAGVRVAVLKGPAISRRYAQAQARTFTDVDLLVPRADLSRVIALLSEDGSIPELPPQRPRADKREVPVLDTATGIRFSLDLHWDAFSHSQLLGRAREATTEAWRKATLLRDSLGPRWELPSEAEVVFLCTHAVLDHRFRLILFRDLAEIAGSLNWDALLEFAGRHRLRSTTYLAWLIAANALDAKVPDGVLRAMRPKGVAMRAAERLLPRTDLVTFDGHRPDPLNLAMVLVHDEGGSRARLALQAPAAIGPWRRRVKGFSRSNPRSLGILVSSTQRRGAEVFCELLAPSLRERGWDTDLVALGTSPGPAIAAKPLVDRSPLGKLDPSTVWRLRRHLVERQPQVLLAFGSATLKYAVTAKTLLVRPPLVAYASIGEPLYWARTGRQRLAYRALLGRVDLVLSVSERTSAQLQRVLGVPAKKLRVTPIGVRSSFLRIAPREPTEELRVLFAGSLSEEKDPLVALAAFARLTTIHAARMRVLGGGPLAPALQRRVEELRLGDVVELLGPVDDIEPHLAWADVLLLTSQTEGLPAVVLEAAAASLAVVAYDVGGVSEAIVDPESGRLVSPGDLDGLVTALAAYASNRAEARRAGQAGRARVAARFTIEAAARTFDEALSSIADQP